MVGFEDGQTWQFKCPFRKAWVDCSDDENAKLKQSYLKLQSGGSPEVAYLLSGVRFKTDFESMQRVNVASRRHMEVRLSGGELPFPPPAQKGEAQGPAEKWPEASQVPEGVPLAPDSLSTAGDGTPFPHTVRKAWGHGIPTGVTMSGKFDFTLELEDKDHLGEMLTWHMLAAGVLPEQLDSDFLSFTSRLGQAVRGDKQRIEKMLGDSKSYPVKVSYGIPKMYQNYRKSEWPMAVDYTRVLLRWVQRTVDEMDHKILNVKHRHQRCTFERYQLFLEDHYYQNDDDLSTALGVEEFIERHPDTAFYFNLINKTMPNLARVLRGEADVLEFLFG